MQYFKKSLLVLFTALLVQNSWAQNADDVINNYIVAIGGKEKLLALKTLKMTGSMSIQGMEISVITTTVQGVGFRSDIAVPGMGEGYQIITPTKGISYMPFQGQSSPEDMDAERVKSGQLTLDIQNYLLNYKEKGHQVLLVGKEKVNGVECYHMKLTTNQGKIVQVYFDANTFYKVKTVSTMNINGEEKRSKPYLAISKKRLRDMYFLIHKALPMEIF
jgi:hypothetical protein